MKRKLGTSTLKFKGGSLTDIENAMSALTLQTKNKVAEGKGMAPPTPVLPSIVLSLRSSAPQPEYWWTTPTVQFKQVTRV
jgi:hypothetical protein